MPVSSDLTAVNFPTPQKGWAVGHDGVVLHIDDGGATWIKQLDGYSAFDGMHKYYTENPPKDLPAGAKAIKRFMADVEWFVEQGPGKPFSKGVKPTKQKYLDS